VRVGVGYDVHRLGQGRRCLLGGVELPHTAGPAGHSDGDVLLHAIIDALLGAAALGDIGSHFPPGDPRFKDADSAELLRRVVKELDAAGWRIENVDGNVIAEAPRIAPHIPRMRERIAAVLGVEVERVSVKAKTNEGLGPIGEGVAIAAQAVVLIAGR
jgi:2-C-methyl-D-erythritol 2,4-cyclodiphosphate synthase